VDWESRARSVSERAVRKVVMGESQEEIDALLANVSQLAAETAADITGSAGPNKPAAAETAASTATAPGGRIPKRKQVPSSQPAISPSGPARLEDPQRILRLEVPVIVTLAERTMPLSKILTLSPGSIVEFDKPSDEMLDLMINNRCVGRGQAVKVGENFGLRVTIVGTVKHRIEAVASR
jgi:flagellar motor switch protein FliN/FliY